jgi:hypothetical protein
MGGVFCVQANSWSLEELHLDVTIAEDSDQPSFDYCSFWVEGLKLTGAVCRYLAQLSYFCHGPKICKDTKL